MEIGNSTIARIGIIAGIYLALCLALQPFSYGPVQVRVAEALTLLPVIMPESIVGLFLGAILANSFGGLGFVDIIFGSLATLVAAYLTYALRHTPVYWLPPIVVNALVVGYYLSLLFFRPVLETMAYVALGQTLSVVLLGMPLLRVLRRHSILGVK